MPRMPPDIYVCAWGWVYFYGEGTWKRHQQVDAPGLIAPVAYNVAWVTRQLTRQVRQHDYMILLDHPVLVYHLNRKAVRGLHDEESDAVQEALQALREAEARSIVLRFYSLADDQPDPFGGKGALTYDIYSTMSLRELVRTEDQPEYEKIRLEFQKNAGLQARCMRDIRRGYSVPEAIRRAKSSIKA